MKLRIRARVAASSVRYPSSYRCRTGENVTTVGWSCGWKCVTRSICGLRSGRQVFLNRRDGKANCENAV